MKSIFLCLTAFLAMIANLALATNPPVFSEIHGYKDSAFILEITTTTEGAKIYYTTDCTTPSPENGTLYTEPFEVSNTSTLRAVAVDAEGNESVLTAATYIFVDDVLHQGNRPEGYPTEWGPYASISGTAIADYEMDPELTDGEVKAANIKSGLFSLPAISIITEPGFLFSHEMDDERGGIYIYTGGDAVSSGNGYGDGWLRAALQLTEDCVIKARIRSGANWGPLMERSVKVKESDGIFEIQADNLPQKSRLYDLMGRPVSNNTSGIFIQNGKIKVQMK